MSQPYHQLVLYASTRIRQAHNGAHERGRRQDAARIARRAACSVSFCAGYKKNGASTEGPQGERCTRKSTRGEAERWAQRRRQGSKSNSSASTQQRGGRAGAPGWRTAYLEGARSRASPPTTVAGGQERNEIERGTSDRDEVGWERKSRGGAQARRHGAGLPPHLSCRICCPMPRPPSALQPRLCRYQSSRAPSTRNPDAMQAPCLQPQQLH